MDSTKISAPRHILVANGKGGCGKTTVATNLAAAYASAAQQVALWDYDPQASTQYWAEIRHAREEACARIEALASFKGPRLRETLSFSRRASEGCDVIVIDAPSLSTTSAQFENLVRMSDVIVVPVMASSIDIRTSKRFITDLLTHRIYRARPRPIGVVGNRIATYSANYEKLEQFLACSGIATISQFRDTPVYSEAADQGIGVIEMSDNRAARREYRAWHTLTSWIDEQTPRQFTNTQAGPRAAGRKGQHRAAPIDQTHKNNA
ncbi:MAG: partition-related protein [Gammaproteobacteria bacterium]|nr:partition-related protein [Gammaproteobacteria bacterium]